MATWVRGGLLLVTAMLSGCTLLPRDGPASGDIVGGAAAALSSQPNTIVYSYALVDISPRVIDCLADVGADSFFKTFGHPAKWREGSAPAIRIGKGDVLEVAILESPTGGLFPPPPAGGDTRSGNFVRTPSQTVDSLGEIAVPHAGKVHVAGRTLSEIGRDIESKLAKLAIEPQVIVNVVEQNNSAVTLIGDALPGSNRFKISGSGERILDMISKAGGLRFPGYDVFVVLRRKNRVATVHFPALISDVSENIFVEPGDMIYVYKDQRKYVALGAVGATSGAATSVSANSLVGAVGQFAFDQPQLSLHEAIAKAGGLVDNRADPARVYVFRLELRETLEKMGVDLSNFPPDQKSMPTIYKANFRDPSSFFFTQKFMMRNKDAIYVGTADATEFSKLLSYVRDVSGTVSQVAADASTVAYRGP
jgi:polysaccharide biosynthesis/export protein